MVTITEQYLTDIADAIRVKNGSSAEYTPAQMAGRISNLFVADEVAAPAQNTVTQICDNTSGTKPKSFKVSLQINSVEKSQLAIFIAEELDGNTITGTAAALIEKVHNAVISSVRGGYFQSATAGGTASAPLCEFLITLPAGTSRTVNIIGHLLKYG